MRIKIALKGISRIWFRQFSPELLCFNDWARKATKKRKQKERKVSLCTYAKKRQEQRSHQSERTSRNQMLLFSTQYPAILRRAPVHRRKVAFQDQCSSVTELWMRPHLHEKWLFTIVYCEPRTSRSSWSYNNSKEKRVSQSSSNNHFKQSWLWSGEVSCCK